MPCYDAYSIIAAGFALAGSFILVWPVWKASCLLKMTSSLFSSAKKQDGPKSFQEGIKATAESINNHVSEWTPANHFFLIAGIACMLIGGVFGLGDALCG